MQQGLTIVPISGLGNRIRVTVSACVAARGLSLPVRIVWQPARDCCAHFSDLFLPLQDTGTPATIDAGSWRDSPATKKNLWIPWLWRKIRYKEELRCFHPSGHFDLQQFAASHSSLYIATCYALGSYEADDVGRLLHPTPSLAQQINETAAHFTAQTIGVHIRRTDNRQAILHSPLGAFRKRIDHLLDGGQADSVYLCTDDDAVRQYLIRIYGSRLITRQPQLSRATQEGMRDAVIDMWTLARTHRILGSFYSSFSETAAELGNVPWEVVTTQQ